MVCQRSFKFCSLSLAAAVALSGLTGCSSSLARNSSLNGNLTHSTLANEQQVAVFDTRLPTTLAEGSISLTRAAPPMTEQSRFGQSRFGQSRFGPEILPHGTPVLSSPINDSIGYTMLGLMPGSIPALLAPRITPAGVWLSFNESEKKVSVMDSGTEIFSAKYEGNYPANETLGSSDELSVLLKQRNAVWFAPEGYYTARNMEVPPTNSRARYLKAALGDFVMYLSENFALYSGPLEVPEISGIKLASSDLARIYYLMPIGSKVLKNS